MPHRLITETWTSVRDSYNMLPRHVSGRLQGVGLTSQDLQNLDLQELQNLQNIPENQRTPQQQQRFQQLQNILVLNIEAQTSLNGLEDSFYQELDRRVRDPALLSSYTGLKAVEVRPRQYYVGDRQNLLKNLIPQLLQQTQVNIDGWPLQQPPFNLHEFDYTLFGEPLDNDMHFENGWYQFTNQHGEFADRFAPNTSRHRRENQAEMISVQTGNGRLTITRYGLRVQPSYLLELPTIIPAELEGQRRFFDQVASEIYGIRRPQEQSQPRRRFWFFG